MTGEWPYDEGLRVLQIAYRSHREDARGPDERLGYGAGEGDERGVTDLGRRAIAEMNQLGMVVDCSHCNRQPTLDAAAMSTKPILANHANAKAGGGRTGLPEHPADGALVTPRRPRSERGRPPSTPESSGRRSAARLQVTCRGDDEAVGGVGVKAARQTHAVDGHGRLDRDERDTGQGESLGDPLADLTT